MTGFLSAAEAFLATDTLGASLDPDVPSIHVAKAIVLPHLHCVIATRGHVALPANLVTIVQNTPLETYCVDDLLPLMPALIEKAYAYMIDVATDQDIDLSGVLRSEVLVLGWSPRHGRPIGQQFRRSDIEDPYQAIDVPAGYFVVPGADADDQQRIIATLGQRTVVGNIIEFAKAQRESVDREIGEAGIYVGGRLNLVRITRDRIVQEAIFQWPDAEGLPPLDQARAGATVAATAGMSRQQRRAAERQAAKRR